MENKQNREQCIQKSYDSAALSFQLLTEDIKKLISD